jgi:hypothetical protein
MIFAASRPSWQLAAKLFNIISTVFMKSKKEWEKSAQTFRTRFHFLRILQAEQASESCPLARFENAVSVELTVCERRAFLLLQKYFVFSRETNRFGE